MNTCKMHQRPRVTISLHNALWCPITKSYGVVCLQIILYTVYKDNHLESRVLEWVIIILFGLNMI